MKDRQPVDPDMVDLTAAVRTVLEDRGALSEDELLTALEAAGLEVGDDLAATLDEALDDEAMDLAVPLTDGRWVWLPGLLGERLFTHRLTDREVAYDLLDLTPDLEPVATLTDSDAFAHLADGGADSAPVIEVLAGFDAELLAERGIPADAVDSGGLLLPPGYLNRRGLVAGDLLGMRVTPTGLAIEQVSDDAVVSADSDAVAAALRAVLAAAEDVPIEIADAVWTACADDPALFTGVPGSLSATIDAAGLARQGEWLAPAGFDFARWQTGNRLADLAYRYDLGEDEAVAVLVTVLLYERVADLVEAAQTAEQDPVAALTELYTGMDGPGRTVSEAIQWLSAPAVAEAVLAETMGAGREGAAALGLFAETMEPQAPRAARVALHWLHGKALDRLGLVAEAEAAYQRAESLDPAWTPVVIDLAHYASDRGDATRSLALLRRAGAPADDPMMRQLARFEVAPRSDLGRNQPCWCGSGRKYKQCHLGRERAPLAERSGWLYDKATQFVLDGPWQEAALTVAHERARFTDSEDGLMTALADPLVMDAVLFEGGAFGDFVATRGFLLPEDEGLLAGEWLLAERSVYDIQTVRRGAGLTVRDVRTGDVHQVTERTASRELAAGDLICARIVPAGEDTMQIFGGVEPVALHQRDELIALLDGQPDPVELVAVLTRRFAPPTLFNTEHEPLTPCEATLRVPDPAGLARTLDHTYDRVEDRVGEGVSADTANWVEHVTAPGDTQYLRATLRLTGDQLQVQTNSESRMDRVLAALRAAQPAITVLAETRRPAEDLREAQDRLGQQQSAGKERSLDPRDPEVAAALDQFVRDYEQRWLDEPVPALAGYTPRQCAADPTRRPDLIRLLDSFPSAQGNPGTMEPERLRTALGLT